MLPLDQLLCLSLLLCPCSVAAAAAAQEGVCLQVETTSTAVIAAIRSQQLLLDIFAAAYAAQGMGELAEAISSSSAELLQLLEV
jgi:hypothetical protein